MAGKGWERGSGSAEEDDPACASDKPASLVLDDALVFSDEVRFDAMLEILTELSHRMQVIVLTCRASLFRSLDANKVRMSRSGD